MLNLCDTELHNKNVNQTVIIWAQWGSYYNEYNNTAHYGEAVLLQSNGREKREKEAVDKQCTFSDSTAG